MHLGGEWCHIRGPYTALCGDPVLLALSTVRLLAITFHFALLTGKARVNFAALGRRRFWLRLCGRQTLTRRRQHIRRERVNRVVVLTCVIVHAEGLRLHGQGVC